MKLMILFYMHKSGIWHLLPILIFYYQLISSNSTRLASNKSMEETTTVLRNLSREVSCPEAKI